MSKTPAPKVITYAEIHGVCLAALTAQTKQPATSGVPEGWKLVPIEPTQAMIDAVVENSFLHESREKFEIITRSDWRDMLAAAPEAPKP